MVVSLVDKLARLSGARRAKVGARAAELIEDEMSLRDLRRALDRTQVDLRKQLGAKQQTVSRLEKRKDMLLWTLRGYVEAMGGELDLIVKFPGRTAVRLKAFPVAPTAAAAGDPLAATGLSGNSSAAAAAFVRQGGGRQPVRKARKSA